MVLLVYMVTFNGTGPTGHWVKDGLVPRMQVFGILEGRDKRYTSYIQFEFEVSDIGVYQCIINKSNEFLLFNPIRLDGGKKYYTIIYY